MKNQYVLKMNDNDMFELYENGTLIKDADWAFELFNFLGKRYNIPTRVCQSESHQYAVLREHIDIEVNFS